MKALLPLLLVCTLVLSGCSSTQQVDDQVSASNNDPLESINRSIWSFNWDFLDKNVVRPVTVAYVDYMPGFARSGLRNAADNLEEPGNTVNNLLQGKVTDSVTSGLRFVVNSTVGLFGTIDVADYLGLEVKKEEFGQTLGVWGFDTGPYLMAPALGPTDVRNATGDIVDSSYFPLADLNLYFAVLRGAVSALEARAQLMEQEQLLYDAVDSYALVRSIYFQSVEHEVKDGKVEPSEQELAEDEELEALLEDF